MAYSKELWKEAKALFEQGKSLAEISLQTGIKDRGSISKRAKKEEWVKYKTQQLKAEIKAFDKDNSTLLKKKSTLVEKVSTLSEFDITILDDAILDETGERSLLFSTANLSLIRKNQMLTKNTKTVLNRVDFYEDGKKVSTTSEKIEIALNANDYKTLDEGIDKNAISLDLAPRHAKSSVELNNNNMQQNNLEENQITISIKE